MRRQLGQLRDDAFGERGKYSGATRERGQHSSQVKPEKDDHYQDGIVIWQNPDDAKVPFLLKFNNNSQIRYLNTINSSTTFTDHLGNVREVHTRNDITVNRAMFILGGYMFTKKLQYSMTVWTSAGAASIVVAGKIGYRFNKGLTLTAGYTGVPGSRSLVATFPFFQVMDRSMADNFFRPGFTQGVWASGEPLKHLNYLVFLGNGVNTLNVTANKINTSLLVSGSVWWEPLVPSRNPENRARCTMIISRPTRLAFGWGRVLPDPVKTASQTPISPVPTTHRFITLTACWLSRPAPLLRE